MRERETDRDRQRERETDRQRVRQTETEEMHVLDIRQCKSGEYASIAVHKEKSNLQSKTMMVLTEFV